MWSGEVLVNFCDVLAMFIVRIVQFSSTLVQSRRDSRFVFGRERGGSGSRLAPTRFLFSTQRQTPRFYYQHHKRHQINISKYSTFPTFFKCQYQRCHHHQGRIWGGGGSDAPPPPQGFDPLPNQ